MDHRRENISSQSINDVLHFVVLQRSAEVESSLGTAAAHTQTLCFVKFRRRDAF